MGYAIVYDEDVLTVGDMERLDSSPGVADMIDVFSKCLRLDGEPVPEEEAADVVRGLSMRQFKEALEVFKAGATPDPN